VPTRRLVVFAVVLVLMIMALGLAMQRQAAEIGGMLGPHASTHVTQDIVVERMQAVAKLVTSESYVRDVVSYENTWYGSTKRSLVVVSGKINAGVNLDRGSSVSIDDATKTIAVTLPKAEILGVEITDMRTYDERGGLWNPFTPQDRDAIIRLARVQLGRSAYDMKILEHAESSAKELLERLLSTDGYTAHVEFAPVLVRQGDKL
jgi:hypothetical protein